MKCKIEIYHEPGVDNNGYPIHETIKTFKNEPEAVAFYNDQRNIRRYGAMFMLKNTEDGRPMAWDDRKEEWISA